MEVVDLKDSQLIWAPVDSTSTPVYREGSLVSNNASGSGVQIVGAASGALDTSTESSLFGIIVGNNDRVKTPDTTYGGSKVTAVVTAALQSARSIHRADGVWGMDPAVRVQVAMINATTKIKAPIYNSTFGTAPTLLTATAVSGTGVSFTSNACDFTPVDDLATSYCRSGKNVGIMRISSDSSTTDETNDEAFPYTMGIGDTFIRVPYRSFGISYAQTDATSTFFDCSASPATNYWGIHVLELHLEEAGKEHVIFTFDPVHFGSIARA